MFAVNGAVAEKGPRLEDKFQFQSRPNTSLKTFMEQKVLLHRWHFGGILWFRGRGITMYTYGAPLVSRWFILRDYCGAVRICNKDVEVQIELVIGLLF